MKQAKHPIVAGILLLVVHGAFIPFGAYQVLPVLDIPMHFLGGVIVAWFIATYFYKEREKVHPLAGGLLIIGGTAVVGVCWELLEWFLDKAVFREFKFMGGLDDTLLDLALDLAGALVVTALAIRSSSPDT